MNGMRRKWPWRLGHQDVRVIRRPWSGYPLSGCSLAEPDSVSPDKSKYRRGRRGSQKGIPSESWSKMEVSTPFQPDELQKGSGVFVIDAIGGRWHSTGMPRRLRV